MKESEERSSNIDEQKARIRQRYKGIDPEELEVIPDQYQIGRAHV